MKCQYLFYFCSHSRNTTSVSLLPIINKKKWHAHIWLAYSEKNLDSCSRRKIIINWRYCMKRVCAVCSCRRSMWALMLPKALRLSPAVSTLVRRSDQTRWRCLGPFYFQPQVKRVDRPRRPQQEEETTKDIHLLAKYSYKPLHIARQSLSVFFFLGVFKVMKKQKNNSQHLRC